MNLQYDFNDKQREAVTTINGSVLVLAGAGSGKTRALTGRAFYMLQQGISPDNILILTFTNKAAEDMKRKIKNLVNDSETTNRLWMGTFHSNCLRILARHLDLIGYNPNYLIYDTDDSKTIIKKVIKKLNLNTDDEIFDENIVFNIIQKAKMGLVSPNQLASNFAEASYGSTAYYNKIADIYQKYEEELQQNNAFDFNDLIKKTIELFRNYPDVLRYYQNKFQYIQIDEYQDTNHSQYLIAKMLAAPQNNIFVVGDPDQSIYAFRGANISNILNFNMDYPDAKIIKLEQNYRSTKNIINASNALIENNKQRKEKISWTANDTGLPIVICEAYNPEEEATFIARTIKNLINQNYDYKDITILYRSNYQSRSIESVLMKYHIPYQIVSGLSFFDRKEIKDLIAYLKLVVNPNDLTALSRIITISNNGIGTGALSKLSAYAASIGLGTADIMENPTTVSGIGKKKGEAIIQFKKNVLDRLHALLDLDISLEDKILTVLQITQYKKYLKKDMKTYENRMENIEEFLNLVYNYAKKDPSRGIHKFLLDLMLISDQDKFEDNKNNVKLMTIHASKGLEFPIVFVVGMEEEIFPHRLCMDSEDSIEEERRLCYVAMTRAEKRLFLSYCKIRDNFFQEKEMIPSRFLKEIPQNYTKSIRMAG